MDTVTRHRSVPPVIRVEAVPVAISATAYDNFIQHAATGGAYFFTIIEVGYGVFPSAEGANVFTTC